MSERHLARWMCWYKARRTIDESVEVLRSRLTAGEQHGAVYRCPLSHPDEEPHYHLTHGDSTVPTPSAVARVLAALGEGAYRVDDRYTRPTVVEGSVLNRCDCWDGWVEPGGWHYTTCRAYGMTREAEIAWRTPS